MIEKEFRINCQECNQEIFFKERVINGEKGFGDHNRSIYCFKCNNRNLFDILKLEEIHKVNLSFEKMRVDVLG